MSKSILFALVTAAGSVICIESAFAGHRHGCCANTGCTAPACAATTAAVPAAPEMAQANGGTTYQSFSYEPGTAAPQPAPTYRPMMRQGSSSSFDAFRGDRKFLGQYGR
jgi:hypothetical protein